MYFISKISSFFLLCHIEVTFVNAVNNDRITQLCTCKVMQNHTFFAGVDYSAVVQLLKFIN